MFKSIIGIALLAVSSFNFSIDNDIFNNLEKNIGEASTSAPKSSKLVCVDPGHQRKQNTALEPNAPGSKIMKAKISSGTEGISTKKPEYQLTLEVSMLPKEKLENNNYNVFMIRTSNDVNISNKERATMATNAKCDIYVRIHADGSDNRSVNGISMQTSTSKNPYVGAYFNKSDSLSKSILSETIKSTQAKNRGTNYRDDLTGTNWANLPTALIEMGFMSNPEEDKKLASREYQLKIVEGIYNGINLYFSSYSTSK